jgi:hypothetical protein
VGFGFGTFEHFRIRALLYAGKPNWDLLPTITPFVSRLMPRATVPEIRLTDQKPSDRD